MKSRKNSGFTLVEVLIVVVIMAVLAATIIPQFSNSTADAKAGTCEFNLHTLRSQIELYKSQHDGVTPTATLVELTSTTNKEGTVGTGSGFVYGPYIKELPSNSFTNTNGVVAITAATATSTDVTTNGGWLYHPASGSVYIDHADHFTK